MSLTPINPSILIVIVGILLVIGVALWMCMKYVQKKRTHELRSKFGPEYDKAISVNRDRGHAESELQKRATRVAKFNIHPLKAEERSRYTADWVREQSLFVDDPQAAVNHADTLVQDVMRHRGYPVGDFDQNATDLSVDHPRVVENYRIAHEIALREGSNRSSTEDLRKAMVSYRALFEDLLEQTVDKPEEVTK
jgi:ABC-type nickel/cobalt efflux system permease component RcnA